MYFWSNSWDFKRALDFLALPGKSVSHSCFRQFVALIRPLVGRGGENLWTECLHPRLPHIWFNLNVSRNKCQSIVPNLASNPYFGNKWHLKRMIEIGGSGQWRQGMVRAVVASQLRARVADQGDCNMGIIILTCLQGCCKDSIKIIHIMHWGCSASIKQMPSTNKVLVVFPTKLAGGLPQVRICLLGGPQGFISP